MKLNAFVIPDSFKAARSALKKLGDKGLVVAGGTALHFFGDSEKTAVDISRLKLSGIRRKGGIFRVGATTTVTELMEYSGKGWVLDQVAGRVSSQQVRNISTLGGNIARVFPWADLPVALLALDAICYVEGKKERAIPVDEYFESQPARLFKAGDLLTAVDIPALKAGQGFGYAKVNRVQASFSMMTAAALVTVKSGVIRSVRLAAGAAVPFPRRLIGVEDLLTGRSVDEIQLEEAVAEGSKGISWKGKEGMSDEYAAQLARVTLVDALTAALRRAKGGAA